MLRKLILFAALPWVIWAQDAPLPLESVSLAGTAIAKETVLEMAGFHPGNSVDKAAIEAGCMRLEESGIFQSINYRYAPGPRGYALTLTLADQGELKDAAIDIPGVAEEEAWRWLTAKYPPFDHKVPQVPAAQDFLARQIEQHEGAALQGQHVVARLETEIGPRSKLIVSFQPETLPRVGAMNFSGQRELSASQLIAILDKVVAGDGYTDRRFRQYLELNVRPAYEEHGMYRVRFPSIIAQRANASTVDVNTTIEEGEKFKLGAVQVIGENLPLDAMLAAAKFKPGEIANWTEIQRGIWEMEKPVKRLGYMTASARPERIFKDGQQTLDLKILVEKGPLYRLGRVSFSGLAPQIETQARQVWTMQPGAAYDYSYPSDFLKSLSKAVDLRQFKKFDAKTQAGAGEHMMDVMLVFEPR
jgi:outer membrane protein assembly factor BamA